MAPSLVKPKSFDSPPRPTDHRPMIDYSTMSREFPDEVSCSSSTVSSLLGNASSEVMASRQWTILLFSITTVLLFADQNLMSPNLTAMAEEYGFTDEERDVKLGGDIALAFWVLGAPGTISHEFTYLQLELFFFVSASWPNFRLFLLYSCSRCWLSCGLCKSIYSFCLDGWNRRRSLLSDLLDHYILGVIYLPCYHWIQHWWSSAVDLFHFRRHVRGS